VFLIFLCVFGACFVVALFKYPAIALSALLCLFGVKQWLQSINPFIAVYRTIPNWFIGGIIALALIIKFVRSGSVLTAYPKAGWIVIGLLTYALVSTSWSPLPMDVTWDLWAGTLPYLLMAVVAPLLITSTEDLSLAYKGLLVIGVGLVLLLLLTSNWTAHGVVIRVDRRVTEGNPLAVALMAGYVSSAAIMMNFGKKWRLWSFLRWLIAGACMALAVKSGSRGQFFAMLFCAAALLPFSRKMARPSHFVILVVSLILLGSLGIWAFHSFSGASSRWETTRMEVDAYDRLNMAGRLLKCWYETPSAIVFGLGNSSSFDPKIVGFYPHMVPLEILGEEGLIGFSLFIIILVVSVRCFIRIFKRVQMEETKRGTLAALGAMVCLELILSCKEGSFIGNSFLLFFLIVLGKYEAVLSRENKRIAQRAALSLGPGR